MPKKTKKLSKRQDGKRLNEEGRLSPLEIFQRRMEYYNSLADDELGKGELASRERIGEFLTAAQSAAVELAPYRHPRLQATTVAHSTTSDLEKLLREIEILDDGLLPMHPEVSKTSVRTSQEQPDIGLPKTRH